jgi:hypothetical protein
MRSVRFWALATACVFVVVAGCSDDSASSDNDDGGGASGAGTGAGATGAGTTGTGAGGAGDACGLTGDAEPSAISGITAAHNAARCAVASDTPLPPLSHSQALTDVAQAYADSLAAQGCPLMHSGGPYGENLFWGSGSYGADEVVGAWLTEESCFSNGPFDACSCTCGHYSQIVWRTSTMLGCGVGNCPGGGEVWVCNYDPPGNFLGQNPY